MSRESSDRARRLAELERELRTMGARSVMLSHATASRLGISPTDLETMDILSTSGPLTAGRLAELTGLTTGAITGVVDRLERSGFVRRERDANDRRRVIVHLVADRARKIGKLYQPLARAMAELSRAIQRRGAGADGGLHPARQRHRPRAHRQGGAREHRP